MDRGPSVYPDRPLKGARYILLHPEHEVDLTLTPYQNGVIVDATMKAKLNKMEDKAPKLTGSIKIIFDWLKTGR